MWVIRAYQPADRPACLALMRSNTPEYFAEHEPAEFFADLSIRDAQPEAQRWPYFVVERCGRLLACGGYYVDRQGSATLLWGMVQRLEQGRGVGRALLNYRLRHLRNEATRVKIDTTPQSFGFYQRFGFVQTGYEADGYAKGLDKVLAERAL